MKKEEVRLPPAPQKDRLRAVFFLSSSVSEAGKEGRR